MKDHLKKQPTRTEQALYNLSLQVQADIYTLSMQISALARASKLTPEDFVKVMNESGANSAFYQNCMLVEKRLQEEAKEKELSKEISKEAKESIEQVAIK
jgi:hypothetical protein